MINKLFKNIPRNIIVVAFVAFFSGFGQEMISPILPAYLLLLGFDRAAIGFIDGLLQGATHFFKFISGLLSDKFQNRKGFVFLGYALSSLARPLLALAGGFASIAGLRAADGVGKGMKDAPRDALVADSVTEVKPEAESRTFAPALATGAVTKTGRAFGFHRFIDTAGSVVGPILAAALLFYFGGALTGYRTIFALTAIPGFIALLLILFGIREPRTFPSGKVRGNGRLFRFPSIFWIFAAVTFIAMLTKINDSLLLVRATESGIPRVWLPILFAYFTLIYAVLSYPIGIMTDKYGKLPFITAGWLILSVVHAGFIFKNGVAMVLILYALYGLFFALTEGSGRALIADIVPHESRGSAYAIFNTGIGIAVILGGFLLGRVWDEVGVSGAFTISTIGSLVGFLAFLALLKKLRAEKF